MNTGPTMPPILKLLSAAAGSLRVPLAAGQRSGGVLHGPAATTPPPKAYVAHLYNPVTRDFVPTGRFFDWFTALLPDVPTIPAGEHTTCLFFFWLRTPPDHRARHLTPSPSDFTALYPQGSSYCISGDAFQAYHRHGIDPATGTLLPQFDLATAAPEVAELWAEWTVERLKGKR